MRRYLIRTSWIVFCLSCFPFFPALPLHSEETGVTAGDFRWNGDIEVGYRFTDIDGNEDAYKQYVNLQDGLKLFDLNFLARRTGGTTGPVDYFRLNLNGIGDPFPSGRLEVKKNKAYDFLASYRQFKYYTAPENLGLFSNNFSFDSTIGRGTLLLSVFPKEDIKLNFGYNLVQRSGDALVPRPFFPVQEQDLKERLNEFYVSGEFPIGIFDFFIKQDYWNFKNKNEIDGPIQPEERDETTNTYVSTIKAHTRLGERLDLNGAFVYAHSEGNADLTTTPVLVPSGSGETNFNTYIAEMGLSYLLLKDLTFHFDFRFHCVDQDGRADTDIFLNAPPANSPASFNEVAYTGTFQLEYVPLENLTLRGGYQIQYDHVTADPTQDDFPGGKSTGNTQSWNNGWVGSVDWKPYKFLSIFGEYAGANISNPYTWISVENQTIGKLKIRYDTPIKNLSLKGSALWTRRTNAQQDYTRDVQDYTATVTYQPVEPLSMDFSFTYEKILDGKDIFIYTGPSFLLPKVDFNSDAYIYSGGISWDIYEGFGAGFHGSYAKTKQNNPQNYADGVLSFWYKNRWVTPILTLERTYLVDQLNRNNNFDANLLTISLRKEF